MKKFTVIVSVLLITLFSFKSVPYPAWTFDAAHSNLGFSITHLLVADIEGTFKIKEATITAPNADFSDATVTFVADAATIDTDNDMRDEHLRKADFFNVATFPDVVFKSTSFKKTGDKQYKVAGDLSLHGITKPVTLDVIANTMENPMDKKTVAGFKVTGTIKRTDFGIAASAPASMLSDDVAIRGNVKFIMQ
ncbi:MAG: YceI family protein [Ferruginibacter sp.]